MMTLLGRRGTVALGRWRGRGGRRTGRQVAGCLDEAVAEVDGAGGRPVRAIDGRRSVAGQTKNPGAPCCGRLEVKLHTMRLEGRTRRLLGLADWRLVGAASPVAPAG
jgi:hypothetical protein